ncbi:MAG: hypothetical protein K1X89_06050 [Myxococcaceae bacterium]|nr:hypothetical protein [Myxococcaceae bacterium]
MNRNLWLVGAVGFTLGLLASCGGGAKNICLDRNIKCDGALTCDPSDGVCKCGGRGGVLCPDGFSCDPVKNTCTSSKCAAVDCSGQPGTSCDVFDGVCKCGGTGGKACDKGFVCNPNARECVPTVDCRQVACPKNQTCDTVSGKCACGGSSCMVGQFCSLGADAGRTCVDDLCAGVRCSGATTCDPSDGYCKCNGAVCQSGEACSCGASADGGACQDTARTCRPGSACAGKTCPGQTTCDPVDGQCKCGGPGGPVCASNQICALGPPAQCQGGQQCTLADGGSKLCEGGTSCDPEDGVCKCGGRGGTACKSATATEPAEICIANPIQQSCRRPCDVRSPDCANGTYCFFDSSAATPASYCAAPTDNKDEDSACATATACFKMNPAKALHCNGLALGQSGICRAYCDVDAMTAGCTQVPKAQTCVQINAAPPKYGYCQPQ